MTQNTFQERFLLFSKCGLSLTCHLQKGVRLLLWAPHLMKTELTPFSSDSSSVTFNVTNVRLSKITQPQDTLPSQSSGGRSSHTGRLAGKKVTR